MNIIIVHGEKPPKFKTMHRELRERLEEALKLLEKESFHLLVVTGGPTRKGVIAEAEIAYQYVKDKVRVPILIEKEARTTSENIRFTKLLLVGKLIDQAVVITSKRRIRRASYLYKKLWHELHPHISFHPAADHRSSVHSLAELFYLLISIIDPYEKYLARIPKKIFRN